MKSLAQFRFVVNSFFPLFFAVIILPVHKQVIWWLVFRDIAGDPALETKSTLHQTGGQVQLTMVLSLKKKNLILKSSEYVAYLIHSNIYKKTSFFQSYICIKKLNSSTNVKSMSFTIENWYMYHWDFLLWQVFRDYVQCWWERKMRMLQYFTFCCVRPWCLCTSVFLWPHWQPTTAACCTNSLPTDSSSRCGGLCLGEGPKLSSKCRSRQYPSVSIKNFYWIYISCFLQFLFRKWRLFLS